MDNKSFSLHVSVSVELTR